jgi:hypothetical protein
MNRSQFKLSLVTATTLAFASLSQGESNSRRPSPDVDPQTTAPTLQQANVDQILDRDPSRRLNQDNNFWLTPGLYDFGEVGNGSADQYMLIDQSVNDRDHYLAIVFPKSCITQEGQSFTGQLYYGQRLNTTQTVMLSPAEIDSYGNLSIRSQTQRYAPVLELFDRGDGFKFPIAITGRNGAMGNGQFAARASKLKRPSLETQPSNGTFVSRVGDSASAIFYNGVLRLNDGKGNGDSSYQTVPLNGSLGRFTALVPSKLDTMTGREASLENIEGLAVFISGSWDQDLMLVARPLANGEFRFRFYKMAEASWLERNFNSGKVRHPSRE